MSFNINRFNNLTKGKTSLFTKSQPNTSNFAKFLYPFILQQGEYLIRILPEHPSRNPDGIQVILEHKLQVDNQVDVDKTYTDEVKFICPRMYAEDCFLCNELEKAIAYEEEGNPISSQLVSAPMWASAPIVNRRLYILMLCKLKTVKEGKWDSIIEVTPSTSQEDTHPFIFVVKQKTIIEPLEQILQDDPLVADINHGKVLKLTKMANKYDLRATTKTWSLTDEDKEKYLSDISYPKLNEIGIKNYKKSNEWIESIVKNSLWYKEGKRLGYFDTEVPYDDDGEVKPDSFSMEDIDFSDI